MPTPLLRALILGTAYAVPAAPASAQAFRVPLDVTSGMALNSGGPTPFDGSLRLAVTRRFRDGNLLAGVAGAVLYQGGDWAPAGGVRVAFRPKGAGLVDAGLFLVGEALIGDGVTPLSLGAVGELPVLIFLRCGVWATYDVEREQASIALLLGTDLALWARKLFGGAPRPRRIGEDP